MARGIAMSGVTGLHDSENKDDFQLGLVVLCHDQWFEELCFSVPEAALGGINPSTACSSRNTSALSSRAEGRGTRVVNPQEVAQMLEMNSSLPACSWSTSVNAPQTNPEQHKYPLLSLLPESFIKRIIEPLLENKLKVTLPAWKQDTGQNSAAKRTTSWQTLKGAVTDVPLCSDTCTSPGSALWVWFQCQVWLFQV